MRRQSLRFEDVTETTGIPVTAEGASMMYTRYAVAAELAVGRRVLEVACGGGNGLGLVGSRARALVGGDFSTALLRQARSHYGARVPLVRLTAERLPFRAQAFDLVLFFEATYYVPDMQRAFAEVTRVLAPGGTVLFVNANPDRPDFITSPHSVQYHSADEFRSTLGALGCEVSVEGAFPVEAPAADRGVRVRSLVLGLGRRVLQTLRLVPRTLRGRARLKRIIYGRQHELPPELPEGYAPLAARTPVPPGPVRGHKVIYVSGTTRR